jgi:uncharacterized membrane protein YfcA
MVVFGSLVAQLVSLGAVRRAYSWRRLLPFLIGGIAGVPLGVLLLDVIDLRLFRGLTGVVLIVYCTGMLLARDLPPLHRGGRIADTTIDAIGGIMGGLAGLTGPVPTLWCTLRRWDKDVQRSVFQSFNLAMHAITLAAYGWIGVLTAEVGAVFGLMLPVILLPSWLGMRLYSPDQRSRVPASGAGFAADLWLRVGRVQPAPLGSPSPTPTRHEDR